MLSLALDTCLLIDLDDWGRETAEDWVSLELTSDLMGLFRAGEAELLLDVNHRILNEYEKHLRGKGLGQRIVQCAMKYSAVTWRSDKLSAKNVRHLESEQFDPSDYPFLEVAQKVRGVYGTTERKHLTVARVEKVLKICHVRIMSIPELQQECSRIRYD